MQKLILANGDYVRIYGANLANAEFFKVSVRGRIRGRLPVVDTTGSNGTKTLSTTYARIV